MGRLAERNPADHRELNTTRIARPKQLGSPARVARPEFCSNPRCTSRGPFMIILSGPSCFESGRYMVAYIKKLSPTDSSFWFYAALYRPESKNNSSPPIRFPTKVESADSSFHPTRVKLESADSSSYKTRVGRLEFTSNSSQTRVLTRTSLELT